jgi:galactitol-specific phosphotransferase system IIC component
MNKYWYMQDRIGFFGAGLLIGFAAGVAIMIFVR